MSTPPPTPNATLGWDQPVSLPPEPYRIKMVEAIRLPDAPARSAALAAAGLNPFLLHSEDVYVDLLTDSGVGPMSDRQWAGMMVGDESYAGARGARVLGATITELLGFRHYLPTHQGRGAENVVDAALVSPGSCIPGNMHFDTTRAHILNRGGEAVDCTIDEAYAPQLLHPFKGNVDLDKLRAALPQRGGHAPKGPGVAYVLVTVTCNSAGGQPVSLENLREVSELCHQRDVPLFLDIARFAENAYFIQRREEGCRSWSLERVIAQMMATADGVLMSAKKNALVNIGGFVAMRDSDLYERLTPFCVLYEGFVTYGGLAGRELEAMAIGLREGVRAEHLAHRIGQVHHLCALLDAGGIPQVKPFGGHGAFVDAGALLPHIRAERFPGHALANELYLEGGVRGVEIGSLLAGRHPRTLEQSVAPLELLRLAVPPRLYTRDHLAWAADALVRVGKRAARLRGVEFVREAPVLRHFTSTFRWSVPPSDASALPIGGRARRPRGRVRPRGR